MLTMNPERGLELKIILITSKSCVYVKVLDLKQILYLLQILYSAIGIVSQYHCVEC